MTMHELIHRIQAVDEIHTMFKWVEGRLVLIFWKGHSPIASVFVDDYEYRKDYPKLFEMDFTLIFEIDQALYEFTQTPVEERELIE